MNVSSSTQTQYAQSTNKTNNNKEIVDTSKNENIKSNTYKKVQDTEESIVDKFLEDVYSKKSITSASAITKDTIQNKVNEYAQVLMESRGDAPKSESDISKMLNDYKKELLTDYKKSLDGATNDNMTLEQQAIIKVLLEENTQEASALEKLLATKEVDKKENVTHKETRSIKEIIAEYRAMPGMNGIAYEGMFEQQIENSLKKHEASFIADYPLYEKYKDVFTPMYSNYTTEKANNIGRALDAQFPDFKAIKDKAYLGGTEKDMEDFENMFFDYQAYNKYLREKYDMDITAMGYTQEGTKAYNFAVYEQLEKGVDLAKAESMAHSVAQTFGGMEGYAFSIGLFNGLPTDMAAAMEIPEEEIDYTKQIDLRDVGFDHNFWTTDYTKKFGLDELGIKSRILYDVKLYSFLLENNEIVDKKFEEFKNRAYEGESSKEWYDWQNSDGKLV